jgi:16S rRNA processing protein RimM
MVVDEERVVVGRIVKPHGIRGEVVVVPMSDRPGRFEPGVELSAAARSFTIVSSRPHQGRLLIRFAGVEDRTAAERLRGTELEAETAADPGDTELYLAGDLVGTSVIDEDGGDLGVVSALIELPEAAGYDLLEVTRRDGGTWLLPASSDLVEVVADDGAERLVVVDPPEGLIEGEPEVVPPEGG